MWQQTFATTVGLQGLDYKRLSPLPIASHVAFPFPSFSSFFCYSCFPLPLHLFPPFFVAPIVLFHNSMHTQKQKKETKNKQRYNKNLK